MPFSLYLTKHARYEDVLANKPDALDSEDLRKLLVNMAGIRPIELNRGTDGAIRVFRQQPEEPDYASFCRVGLRPNNGPAGTIELAVSPSHGRFIANAYELLGAGAWFTEHFPQINAFEAIGGMRISVDNFDALMDEKNPYVLGLVRLHTQHRNKLFQTLRMPFELPLNEDDDAPNMASFWLEHPKLPQLELATLLAEPPAHLRVEVQEPRGYWLHRDTGEVAVWFQRNPDNPGELIIWPEWSKRPFVETAKQTYAAARQVLARAKGGKLHWNQEPATDKALSWMKSPRLLAVELYELLANGQQPKPRSPFKG